MNNRVTCSCGWSWNKSDSSKKDMYVCHQCGKDNTMKDGGWLNKFEDAPDAQNGIEGTMGGLTDKGFNYNGAWGGTMQMGGSLPGSVGFTYARTQSPAPSNGPYAKKTKASAQTGEAIIKTDTDGSGAPEEEYIKLDPTKFTLTTTRGVSETFDPNNAKWTGQSTEWLQKRIKNAELLVQAIKDAKSLPKKEWEEKYKGASFVAVGEGKAQPILPEFYNDYKKKDDAFIQDWSQARSQAKNELLMQSRWTANKEKAKKEALDFLGQYKNQNEFLSNIPTQSAEKYGYTPGELEKVSPWQFLSKDAVSKAYYAINANKGFPLPQDPTNEMTCANGVCTIESMIGVDFSPLKGKKGVYYDPETGYTIPQYNPTWLENENYKKVGYRKLDNLNELPQPGDIVQYSDEKGVPGHMELVLENLPNGIVVYNNYSQTNDYRPGEGKEVRGYKPGTYQQLATDNFAQTNYFRLTPEAQQKALSRNPEYIKKVEGKKAFESSEDYKKFMEAQEYTKANQEKYNKFSQLNPQDWRNGGRTSAQNGQEMRFYQEGLDWKPKNISRDGGWLSKYEEGGIIEDPMGQWAHPGEITRIPSNQITMQGVDYPVLGISDTGDTKMMKPGKDYKFKGKSVTEVPMMQKGGEVIKVKQPDGSFKTYNTNSEEYRKLYDSGNLMNYDKSTDTYIAKPLDEVVITGQAPEKGFWEQYRDDLTRKHNSGILDAVLGTPIDAVFGLPQRAMMYGLTGKVQDPSEALGIENPYGALAVNVLGDPLNAFGLGLTDDALRLTGKASQGLREVGQYLPARGQVISELKDLKRAAFPTKPTFINPSEQELLSTIRNVGLLSKTGAKDADILEKVLAKSSRLTDDEFKNLVGSTRSELKGKIQALRETPKGAKKVGENQFEWDVNPNANQSPPPILDANGNPISTSGNINLNRPARSQAARDAASSRRQGRQVHNLYDQLVTQQGGRDLSPQQMNILQTFVDDTYQLIRTDPDNAPNFSDFTNPAMMDLYNFKLEPNKSFIRGLTNRINEGRYLPQSYEQADAVLPNLYRDETNNPIAEMFKAMRIVERSPKGSTLKSAGSLSTDSYPATLRLSERLRDKGIVDINYTGMSSLNPSGFSQTAGIPTNINLKEMNTLIDQLNKTLPKPLPFGYIEGNYMKVPQISVTRKKNGGWLNKYE